MSLFDAIGLLEKVVANDRSRIVIDEDDAQVLLHALHDLSLDVLKFGDHRLDCAERCVGAACDCGFHVASTDADAIHERLDGNDAGQGCSIGQTEPVADSVSDGLSDISDKTPADCSSYETVAPKAKEPFHCTSCGVTLDRMHGAEHVCTSYPSKDKVYEMNGSSLEVLAPPCGRCGTIMCAEGSGWWCPRCEPRFG